MVYSVRIRGSVITPSMPVCSPPFPAPRGSRFRIMPDSGMGQLRVADQAMRTAPSPQQALFSIFNKIKGHGLWAESRAGGPPRRCTGAFVVGGACRGVQLGQPAQIPRFPPQPPKAVPLVDPEPVKPPAPPVEVPTKDVAPHRPAPSPPSASHRSILGKPFVVRCRGVGCQGRSMR